MSNQMSSETSIRRSMIEQARQCKPGSGLAWEDELHNEIAVELIRDQCVIGSIDDHGLACITGVREKGLREIERQGADGTSAPHTTTPNDTGRHEGSLPATPPELIQNIHWLVRYGRQHWGYVLIACVVILAVWAVPKCFEERKSVRADNVQTIKSNDHAGLDVTLRDNTRVSVGYGVGIQVIPSMAPMIVETFGEQDEVQAQLLMRLRSIILAELETHTLDDLRTNRPAIGSRVLCAFSSEASNRYGHVVDFVNINEVEPR